MFSGQLHQNADIFVSNTPLGRPLARSVAHSLARSPTRSLGRPLARSLAAARPLTQHNSQVKPPQPPHAATVNNSHHNPYVEYT